MFESEFHPLCTDLSLLKNIKNNLDNHKIMEKLNVQELFCAKPPNFRKLTSFERKAIQKHANGDIQDIAKLIKEEIFLLSNARHLQIN